MYFSRILLSAALLFASLATATAQDPPPLPREFRAAWVASVYNLNWPTKPGLSVSTQKAQLVNILDRAASLRMNCIVLQVRPACDALYASPYEPWSRFLTGSMGKPPSPYYDPLKFAISEAHKRGIELHAWFNPFRASTSGSASSSHVTRKKPSWVRTYGKQKWLDPGLPEVREYSTKVILDVVKRYEVDGIHLDDYFYPYPIKNKELTKILQDFPDQEIWNRYRASGGRLSKGDWRRQNVDLFVSNLYGRIKSTKPWVKFGISPFGIWRPRVPSSIEAKLDSYNELYADSRKWLREGWVDYFTPQLYWEIKPRDQSFPVLLDWWGDQNVKKRHLWPGIASDRIGASRPAMETVNQIAITRKEAAKKRTSAGHIHWSIKPIMENRRSLNDALVQKSYAARSLVPASPWLSRAIPKAPNIRQNGASIAWTSVPGVRFWAVQLKSAQGWSLSLLPASRRTITLPSGLSAVAVRTIDIYGAESKPVLLHLK